MDENELLPGCSIEIVSWVSLRPQQPAPSRLAIVHHTSSERVPCRNCKRVRILRASIGGHRFCSVDCAETYFPRARRRRVEMPVQQELQKLLRYDPVTGFLYWRKDNQRAFTVKQRSGYYVGNLSGETYLAHRIIWKLVHGVDPDVIDHINRAKGDNRIENLRDVTQQENIDSLFRASTAAKLARKKQEA